MHTQVPESVYVTLVTNVKAEGADDGDCFVLGDGWLAEYSEPPARFVLTHRGEKVDDLSFNELRRLAGRAGRTGGSHKSHRKFD